jgi:hypothetical protein
MAGRAAGMDPNGVKHAMGPVDEIAPGVSV